jgi:hypothetical protein
MLWPADMKPAELPVQYAIYHGSGIAHRKAHFHDLPQCLRHPLHDNSGLAWRRTQRSTNSAVVKSQESDYVVRLAVLQKLGLLYHTITPMIPIFLSNDHLYDNIISLRLWSQ